MLLYVSSLFCTVSKLSSSLFSNLLPHISQIPSFCGLLNSKLYTSLQSLFVHTTLFTILSIISLSVNASSTAILIFLLCSSKNLCSSFACSTVLGNPSNITPSLQSSSNSLFSTSFIARSSGTSYPFDTYSFIFVPIYPAFFM